MDDAAFGHWLAGFIDGEGSFGIYKSNGNRGYEDFRFVFSLRLRDDDEAILREIRSRLGIGRFYRDNRESTRAREHSPHQNPQLNWRIDSRAELKVLVELLDRHPLRSKKVVAYRIWREALLSAPRDWPRIAAFKDQLSEAIAYVPRPPAAPNPEPIRLFEP